MKTADPRLKITFSKDPQGQKTLQLIGILDEFFESIPPQDLDSTTALDLAGVTRVNSTGAKLWTTWVTKTLKPEMNLSFIKISPSFIRTLNSLPEMIPSFCRIESFFVPYISPSDELTENVLYVADKHFSSTELIVPPFSSGDMSGEKLVLDVDVARYFAFLRQRNPKIKVNSSI